MTEFTVERGGLSLYGILEKPDLEKCPVVIMHHGFGGCIKNGEDSIFTALSERLLKSGSGVKSASIMKSLRTS